MGALRGFALYVPNLYGTVHAFGTDGKVPPCHDQSPHDQRTSEAPTKRSYPMILQAQKPPRFPAVLQDQMEHKGSYAKR